jgi:hypothetical protein
VTRRRWCGDSAAFVDFLGDIVTSQPATREIHVIAAILSTHKTQAVRTFLIAHPHDPVHFTPTYAFRISVSRGAFTTIGADFVSIAVGYNYAWVR